MGPVWRRVAVAFVLGMTCSGASAQQGDVAIIDDSYAYHRDRTSYDSAKDVIVTLGEDVDFGPFWVAFQCGSQAAWFKNKANGVWKDRETLPEDMGSFRDTLCALRGSLPYAQF